MKEVYQMEKEELFRIYGSPDGLTKEQAENIRKDKGENVFTEKHKKSPIAVFMEQFKDLLVIILIIAAIVSVLSGNAESTAVILFVIVLNAVLGTVQYVKAEKSLDSLKKLSAPKAKVYRDGEIKEILSREIVCGDILMPEAGDIIAADGRIIDNYSLKVNESQLTGESSDIEKKDITLTGDTALADRVNMVYSGSLVTYGRAVVLVTGTGMDTQMGKIAGLMNETKGRRTPLQISLDNFSRKLALVIMVISLIVFGFKIWQHEPVLDSLMFAVALAVAAIPEALGSIVTIVQAMGTKKMAADNAIIKDLKAVETLGCVSVICSDKTGTLTMNKMTVEDIYIGGRCLKPEQLDINLPVHGYFLYDSILNNDSCITDEEQIGDPTEISLLIMAEKAGISVEDIRKKMARMGEMPFDSERKLMSTRYIIHGIPLILTKGALDVILDRTKYIDFENEILPVTSEDKEKILEINQNFSESGKRVLAFAYRECDEEEDFSLDSEAGYTFIGLVSMSDPLRKESRNAVSDAVNAGIKPVMITGDHAVTAVAIAKEAGIFKPGDMVLSGTQLDQMEDEKFDKILTKVSVYARVSPENKIRIVEAWQRRGSIVAMTGDGVNDAPALKKADIGVAMGITGTEVSKDAASMILADDNFATIIKAVLNGRNIYRNILNAIKFLLSGNMAAIFVVLYSLLTDLPTPFEPVHLLFINLLTDSLPALAIGTEPADKTLMNDKPRNGKEGILSKKFVISLVFYGLLIGISVTAAFHIGLSLNPAAATTMAFATLTLSRLIHGFNCRSDKSLIKIGLISNKWSIMALAGGIILLAAVLFVPYLQSVFLAAPLTGKQILSVILLAFLPFLIIQTLRIIREKCNFSCLFYR